MAEADGVDMTHTADPLGSPVAIPLAMSVGPRLRAAREARGLDLQQLSQLTKVTVRHLEAIESGQFRDLPGKPYAIGFSKSYAQAVGLDGMEIAEAVRAELRAAEPAQPARVIHQYEIGEAEKTPSSRVMVAAVLLVLAVAVAGSFAWRSYYWPAAGLPPVTAATPLPAEVATARIPAPPAATAPDSAMPNAVVFTALENGVWVKFYDETGRALLHKQLAKGESSPVPGDAAGPRIWTGRPEALAITVGGQPVPKLAELQTTLRDVPVSAAALLARENSGLAASTSSSTASM